MTHHDTGVGNTNFCEDQPPNKGKRARSWFLTINNFDTHDLEMLKEEKCQYIAFQSERGHECGTLHLHATLTYRNAVHFTALKKKFPRANIQIVRNLTKSREYCLKEDTFDGIRYERNDNVIKIDMHDGVNHTATAITRHEQPQKSLDERWAEWKKDQPLTEAEIYVLDMMAKVAAGDHTPWYAYGKHD